MTRKSDKVYFQFMDPLRFLAAYAIFIFHMFYGWVNNWGMVPWLTGEAGELHGLGVKTENLIHNLSIGVDAFFLLSGFLITYLLLEERKRFGKIAVGKFYMRRVLRIWPLYFLIVATGPLLTYLFDEPAPSSYIPHLLFVGNFELIHNGFSSASLNHLWSICIEEHFYLFCPLIVAFIPHKRIPHVFVLIIIASFCHRAFIQGRGDFWLNMYVNTLSRMDVLSIGCLAGYYYQKGTLKFEGGRVFRWAAFLFFMVLLVNDNYFYWDSFLLATSKKYLYLLPLGYVMADYMFNKNVLYRPSVKSIFAYLGKASYGIYMFNPIIIAVFVKLFHRYQYHDGWVFFIGTHMVLMVISVVSFELFERPILKLKGRFAAVKTRSY